MKKHIDKHKEKVIRQIEKVLTSFLVFAVTVAIIVFAIQYVGIENTREYVEKSGVFAPVIFILICATSLIIAPLSGTTLYVTGGLVFGPTQGFVYSLIATLIGCSVNFGLSKKFGRKIIHRLFKEKSTKKIDHWTDELDHKGFLFLGLAMFFASDFVSYLAGLTKIKYREFVAVLLIESSIGIGAYIYLGDSIIHSLIGK